MGVFLSARSQGVHDGLGFFDEAGPSPNRRGVGPAVFVLGVVANVHHVDGRDPFSKGPFHDGIRGEAGEHVRE